MLQEQGEFFFKNFELLNECKITKYVFWLVSCKNGYCNIVKLVEKNK